MYSTTSNLTKEVCKNTGFIFEYRFVEAFRRGGKVYVRGTAGKREEFHHLKYECEKNGYVYTGTIW